MKPYKHAQSSSVKFGGMPEDYLPIHDYMDSSKAANADVRHRAIFHSAFGIFIVEDVFGHNITNSDGRQVSVRDIAEQHVQEDLGFIPSLEHWVRNMPLADWMMGKGKKAEKKHIPMVAVANSVSEVITPPKKEPLVSPGVYVNEWDDSYRPGVSLEPPEPEPPHPAVNTEVRLSETFSVDKVSYDKWIGLPREDTPGVIFPVLTGGAMETFYSEANTDGVRPAPTVVPEQMVFDGAFQHFQKIIEEGGLKPGEINVITSGTRPNPSIYDTGRLHNHGEDPGRDSGTES